MFTLVSHTDCKVVVVVGTGLVGSATYRYLLQSGYVVSNQSKVNWSDCEAYLSICDFIKQAAMATSSTYDLVVVWSAGKLGFDASPDEIQGEQVFFESFCLNFSNMLSLLERRATFVLLSSVGGLFEGQNLISKTSTPAPKRPYGVLKLRQEELARKHLHKCSLKILRLSSVFGTLKGCSRKGLIQVLILNGMQRKPSKIYGTLDTLRDYVFIDDIAQFIEHLIYQNSFGFDVFHLVSGKPSSIREIKNIIERTLCRTLELSYSLNASNSSDITCVKESYNARWRPGTLESNIRKIYIEWFTSND